MLDATFGLINNDVTGDTHAQKVLESQKKFLGRQWGSNLRRPDQAPNALPTVLPDMLIWEKFAIRVFIQLTSDRFMFLLHTAQKNELVASGNALPHPCVEYLGSESKDTRKERSWTHKKAAKVGRSFKFVSCRQRKCVSARLRWTCRLWELVHIRKNVLEHTQTSKSVALSL